MSTKMKKLLPDIAHHPIMFILLCALPQLILLALHYHTYTLVTGELDADGRGAHYTIFAVLGSCAILWIILGLVLIKMKRRIGALIALLVFAAGFGYLWMVMQLIPELIPASVGNWMISGDELVYNHMILVAPSLFYGLILLAGIPFALSSVKDTVISTATVVAIPLFWAIIAQGFFAMNWEVNFPQWVFIFVIFIMTAVMLLAFLRVMLHLHKLIGKQVWVPFAAALIFPIAGLLLNRAIPFPTDLQDWRVYAFTVLNAIALTLPFIKGRAGTFVWFSRVSTYPFTLYFFILFLPFLPLSIPAMVAAGSGFLILAPTLLFVVHTRRLLSETQSLIHRMGKLRTVALLLLGLSLLPVGYLIRAELHKCALTNAINAVYHPNYAESKSGVNITYARSALIRLHKMKEGIYTPLLSDVYDSIVFGGMVLPDHKMEHMETVLFGELIYTNSTRRRFEFFSFNNTTRNRRRNWQNTRPAPKTVVITDTSVTTSEQDSLVESEVILTMKNNGGRMAEFVTSIKIPRGVGVSGYWLDVEGTQVPGQVFDRKTALWVFHMIRDRTRRDPGIVHYVDDDTLELRVFPFTNQQTRACAIRFLYPRGMTPSVRIGDTDVSLEAPSGEEKLVWAGTESGSGLFVPVNDELPTIQRKPYLHVLINASGSSIDFLPTTKMHIENLLQAHPEFDSIKIDFVNHETKAVADEYLDRNSWAELFDHALKKVRPIGGFWPERAINHALFTHHRSEDSLERVPVFVILSSQTAHVKNSALIPECSPDVIISNRTVQYMTKPVRAFRSADHVSITSTEQNEMPVFPGNEPIEVYDPATGWIPVNPNITLLNESRYSTFATLRATEETMASHPNSADDFRAQVLALSKTSGILSEHTAYIVVENSAQWEILKRKEKDAMKADAALNFDEFQEKHVTPEPGIWLMICMGIPVFVGWRFWLRKRGQCPLEGT